MFTMQNWQEWQCLSANPCQLVWRFFENICNRAKSLFYKCFDGFGIFYSGILGAFANWHTLAYGTNKKAVHF